MENLFSHRKRKGVAVSAGPAKKRKGDVIYTPLILTENAPSSSGLRDDMVCPLDFIIELVLQNSFPWPFQATC
jgi:hypothetical protein